jgi:hypothetical protein
MIPVQPSTPLDCGGMIYAKWLAIPRASLPLSGDALSNT